ncbi:MAG: class I SAM-dependent methyltransferase [Planctomycetales bacterium]|nr:class I SAM-dependent methyltransferase [Planctomycetales bacterium]
MSEETIKWLGAREVQDRRFRNRDLASEFASAVDDKDIVVDMGCGNGANYRYMSELFPSQQRWIGIDVDAEMLGKAAGEFPAATFQAMQVNLAEQLDHLPCGPGIAITASAFLDLVSAAWIDEFACRCFTSVVLIAMTSSGLPEWTPFDQNDEAINGCLQQFRISDHGFGPSLGRDAATYLAENLSRRGCHVTMKASDWKLNDDQSEMIKMMISGIVRRVASMTDAVDVRAWSQRRMTQLERGRLQLTVPHVDLLSLPERLVFGQRPLIH